MNITNWKKVTFTMTNEELRESMRRYEAVESREKRVPWLLKWFMGKGRPKYRWQVWLSHNWPTKEIPKERRMSALMAKEIKREIDNEILEEIMKQIEKEKKQ